MFKKRFVLPLLLMIFPLLLFLNPSHSIAAAADSIQEEKIEIKFYYSNACASCHEESDYEDIVKKGLEGTADNYPHEIWTYNCFKIADKEKYLTELATQGWTEEDSTLPLMVIGNHKVSGEEEMRKHISELLLKEANLKSEENKIVFFSTTSCKDCEKVKKLFRKEEIVAEEYSIDDADNLNLLYQYFHTYKVDEKDQQVPIVFLKNCYISGVEDIKKALAEGMDTFSKPYETELVEKQELSQVFTWKDTGKVILTGLLNGLNPCSASLLLFLLSLFVVSKVSVIKVGFSYLAGRFIAYIATGLGIFSLGSLFRGNTIEVVETIAMWLFLVLAILLGGLNLLDYINIKRHKYEKVILQLPKSIRHWNYEKIRKAQSISSRWLVLAVFALGFVISAGEFLCTGQIYAAIIVSMIQAEIQLMKAVILLCLYVFAMCIPHAVIICLVNKSKNILDASNLSIRQMPYYKLVSAFIFMGFAIWIFYTM